MGTNIRINRQRFMDWWGVYSFVVEINTCWLIGDELMKMKEVVYLYVVKLKKKFFHLLLYITN